MVLHAPILPLLKRCPIASSRWHKGIPTNTKAIIYGIKNAPEKKQQKTFSSSNIIISSTFKDYDMQQFIFFCVFHFFAYVQKAS